MDDFEPEQPTYSVDSAANLEMLWVEPGTFTLGSPETEPGRSDNETQREVTLTKGFYLQRGYSGPVRGGDDGCDWRLKCHTQ